MPAGTTSSRLTSAMAQMVSQIVGGMNPSDRIPDRFSSRLGDGDHLLVRTPDDRVRPGPSASTWGRRPRGCPPLHSTFSYCRARIRCRRVRGQAMGSRTFLRSVVDLRRVATNAFSRSNRVISWQNFGQCYNHSCPRKWHVGKAIRHLPKGRSRCRGVRRSARSADRHLCTNTAGSARSHHQRSGDRSCIHERCAAQTSINSTTDGHAGRAVSRGHCRATTSGLSSLRGSPSSRIVTLSVRDRSIDAADAS